MYLMHQIWRLSPISWTFAKIFVISVMQQNDFQENFYGKMDKGIKVN